MKKEEICYTQCLDSKNENLMDLGSVWKFQLEPEIGSLDVTKPLETKDVMAVPASLMIKVLSKKSEDMSAKFIMKEFNIIEALKSQRIVLRFGSATHTAVVYLNGKQIVTHKGGFTPFEVEINEF